MGEDRASPRSSRSSLGPRQPLPPRAGPQVAAPRARLTSVRAQDPVLQLGTGPQRGRRECAPRPATPPAIQLPLPAASRGPRLSPDPGAVPRLGERGRVSALPQQLAGRERGCLYFKLLSGSAGTWSLLSQWARCCLPAPHGLRRHVGTAPGDPGTINIPAATGQALCLPTALLS